MLISFADKTSTNSPLTATFNLLIMSTILDSSPTRFLGFALSFVFIKNTAEGIASSNSRESMKERKFSDFQSNSVISFEAVFKNSTKVYDILLGISLSAVKLRFTFSCSVFHNSICIPFLAAIFNILVFKSFCQSIIVYVKHNPYLFKPG